LFSHVFTVKKLDTTWMTTVGTLIEFGIRRAPVTPLICLFHPNSGRVGSSLVMVFPQQQSEWDV